MNSPEPKRFATAAAFKASLEERLRREAVIRCVPLNTLRLKLVMERLLARLFAESNPPWLLKGGYAMELRYRPRARTTRDLDLTISDADPAQTLAQRLERVRDQLQIAAEVDTGDYLRFTIAAARAELQGAPLGGARFTCEAILAGRLYGRFHLDLGFGDPVLDEPEHLTGDTLLAFAGIAPAAVLALPRAQQFAEKVHAYTFPWVGRPNTRTKDLVDLVLLIERGSISNAAELRAAIGATFASRRTHAVPTDLPLPPRAWAADYAAMAAEAELLSPDMDSGFMRVSTFWRENALGE